MAMSEENVEKKILSAPSLPNIVQGDGRYLMSLLKDFLAQTATQVNLANGFGAEEIKADTDGSIPTPRNLFISFNRLGGSISWQHIPDVSVLAYYEVRTDTNVGQAEGLLERTLESQSVKFPENYVATIYLFAVGLTGEYSNETHVTYTKARPEAPQNLSLTSNNEGTLITFLEIPTNCIGAYIYINGVSVTYTIYDNVFLLEHDSSFQLKSVGVAYFDNFGAGERNYVYCSTPDVTGFLAERNGPYVDFYWEPLDLYGATYVVKVSQTPDWNKGLEIFRTKLNKHRYIYPNRGDCYFLIKAIDSHNNYSETATYYLLTNTQDIHRNIILEYPQLPVAYSGNKLNVYYDEGSQGIKLNEDATSGEYIMDIELPKEYRARSWIDYKVLGTTNEVIYWNDADFSWDSEKAANISWLGVIGDLNGVSVKHQIAEYIGQDASTIESIRLDESLLTDENAAPVISQKATEFDFGRWTKGLFISDVTYLKYALTGMTSVFNMVFYVKTTALLTDCIIITLRNAAGDFLAVGYTASSKTFYLVDSNGVRTNVQLTVSELDWISIGISQGNTVRKLFVNSLDGNKTVFSETNVAPVGVLDELHCYPCLT